MILVAMTVTAILDAVLLDSVPKFLLFVDGR
jgi:hypothetical protein